MPRFRKPHHTLHYKAKIRADFGTTQIKDTQLLLCPPIPSHDQIILLCNVQYLGADIQLRSKLGPTQSTPWAYNQRRQPSRKNGTQKIFI